MTTDPKTLLLAAPIQWRRSTVMTGSAAFLMPVGSAQVIRKDKCDLLTYVRWLVVIVVVYAATLLLGASGRDAVEPENPALVLGDI